jgi:hypothetical protein
LTDAAAKGRPFSFRKPWVARVQESGENHGVVSQKVKCRPKGDKG